MNPEVAARLSWTRIIAYRRRDRLVILPMSLLAAAGAWVWLGPQFALVWLASNIGVIAISQALCAAAARDPNPGARWANGLAVWTAIHTAAYGALPLGLILQGSRTALAAGLATMGAIILSAADEFVLSRRIGGAALAVSFVAVMVGLVWPVAPAQPHEVGLSLVAVIGFFGYVFQASLKRRGLERQMAQALQAAVDKEQEAAVANAAKSTFLATISHEIRTPLNGVLGMAQAMAAGDLAPDQRERLQVVRSSGEALTEILNDVLDLSKIEAGQLDIDKLAFELDDVLHAGFDAFAPRAAEKGLAFELDIASGAEGVYLGDPMRLRQVVYNLISNAVKFTGKGSVRVRAARDGELVRISVVDTGPGIAADQQARLFHKFEQLDASTTRRHGGTGLGLAICRELATLMGGEILVESRLGEGSAFTLSLPLERTGEGRPAIATAAPAAAPAAEGELRVLAAEDNEVNRTVLKALLAQIGVVPTLVEDGAQAVAAWRDGEWDLVLMDIHMPVMDGMAAVREIRTLERAGGRRRTPIIALTANAMVHQVAELREAGMDDHVSKPINVTRLFEAMAAAVEDGEPVAVEAVG